MRQDVRNWFELVVWVWTKLCGKPRDVSCKPWSSYSLLDMTSLDMIWPMLKISYSHKHDNEPSYHLPRIPCHWTYFPNYPLQTYPNQVMSTRVPVPVAYPQHPVLCNFLYLSVYILSYPIWLVVYPSEKIEFVNWDDYSQYMGKRKMFQTTNQLSVIWWIWISGGICMHRKKQHGYTRIIQRSNATSLVLPTCCATHLALHGGSLQLPNLPSVILIARRGCLTGTRPQCALTHI